MSKTTITKDLELNKRSKSNLNKDKFYKVLLYIITAAIAAVVILSVTLVLISGVKTAQEAGLSLGELLFGDSYNPLGVGALAAGFIVVNTVWMAFLAILIAVPISVGTAIIITKILPKFLSSVMYSVVAILAAIPSVIYGMFGYEVVNSFLISIGFKTGSLMSVILMVSFMIVPTITIMTIAAIKLTDRKMEESSYALGATKTQTSFYVTIKAAKAGIVTGVIFAIGRCLGETTAISIIAPTPSFYDGVVLSPFNASLFLGPAILGLMPGGETTLSIYLYPVVSAFLLSTSMLIFGAMKYGEFITNDANVSKRQSKEINKAEGLRKKVSKYGIGSLTVQEQDYLYNADLKNELNSNLNSFRTEDYALLELQKSSISTTRSIESYKSSKTLQHNLFIYIASTIGVVLLLAIFIYLFNGGFKFLNWDLLTSRKWYGNPANKMYGLSVPMMGTLISILIALAISVPVGASLGLFIVLYIRKDTKFGFFITLILQILTAIPTIVWSTIAALVFIGTSFDDNYKGLEPAIFMGIILLPTIIKTTQDAGNRVKSGLVEGSESLGATKLTTTFSIMIKESFPSIVAAALLGASIVLAESTIFVSLLDKNTSSQLDLNGWIENGGYSLSATIWKLNSIANQNSNHPEMQSAIIDEIKTIGIILMIIIFVLSMSSLLFSNNEVLSGSFLLLSLLLFITGCYEYGDNKLCGMILEVISLISLISSIGYLGIKKVVIK